MSLIEVIKQISKEAVEASKPVELVEGSVLSINPFKVKIDQKLILTDSHLTGDYVESDYVIDDKITMLRIQGGKKYHILGPKRISSKFVIKYDADNEGLIIGG